MNPADPTVLAAIAAIATLASGILAIQLFGRRADPTAPWLFGVAASLFGCVLAFLLLAGGRMLGIVESPVTIGGVSAFEHVARFFTVLACGFWILFAIEYTGRGGRLRRFVGAIVGGLWAAAIGGTLALGYAQAVGIEPPTLSLIGIGFGEFFGTGLAAAGVFFVLGTALRRAAVPLGEAGLLATGAVLFTFASVIANAFEQPVAIPGLLLLSSAAFLLAIDRFPLFEAIPGVRLAGRDRLVEEMDAGLVVTNRRDRIDDLNPAAAAMFGVERNEAIDRPFEEGLTDAIDPPAVAAADEPTIIRPTPDRTVAATGTRIDADDGMLFGHAIVCQDVTEARRRERRLRLLNRFLVETVRDRMQTIADRADTSPEFAGTTPETVGGEISETATRLSELVASVRELERDIAGGSMDGSNVEDVPQEVLAAIDEAGGSLSIADGDSDIELAFRRSDDGGDDP